MVCGQKSEYMRAKIGNEEIIETNRSRTFRYTNWIWSKIQKSFANDLQQGYKTIERAITTPVLYSSILQVYRMNASVDSQCSYCPLLWMFYRCTEWMHLLILNVPIVHFYGCFTGVQNECICWFSMFLLSTSMDVL